MRIYRVADLAPLAEIPLVQLTFLIEARYHATQRKDLRELVELAGRVERVQAGNRSWPKELGRLLQEIEEATADHLAKEEQVFFPMIRSGCGAGASGPVQTMEREHEDDGRARARLRDLTSGLVAPPGADTAWRALYLRLQGFSDELMEHMYVEDKILFPRALCGDLED